MQRHLLVSVASAGLITLSLAGIELTALRFAEQVWAAPERVAVSAPAPAQSGIVVSVEPAPGSHAPVRRPCVVLARMEDGSLRSALLPVEATLREGDAVRAIGGTLVPRELYRSAPFAPVRHRTSDERG